MPHHFTQQRITRHICNCQANVTTTTSSFLLLLLFLLLLPPAWRIRVIFSLRRDYFER